MKDTVDQFYNQYPLNKSNYNIIISSPNGTGKYEFVELIIKKYYRINYGIELKDIHLSPDIYYLSLPLFDKSGKYLRVLSNTERLLYEFGFEDKFENYRVGTDIGIDQIRLLNSFTSITSQRSHKFIIINNSSFLNKQSSAALLKNLEETNSSCIFFLLTSDLDSVQETIKSRCHTFKHIFNQEKMKIGNFYNYFINKIPKIKSLCLDINYLENYEKIEDELSMLLDKKVDPLSLSDSWMNRGQLLIDSLAMIFNILMKGSYLDDTSDIKIIYTDLHKKLTINSARSMSIIKILYSFKKEIRFNLNKKIFYDNLLIVLNRELY